jgi:hypothetical protein
MRRIRWGIYRKGIQITCGEIEVDDDATDDEIRDKVKSISRGFKWWWISDLVAEHFGERDRLLKIKLDGGG